MVEQYSQIMKARPLTLEAGKMISIINEIDAEELGIRPLDRIEIFNPKNNKRIITVVNTTSRLIKENEVGLYADVKKKLGVTDSEELEVKAVPKPESIEFIKKKMNGGKLTSKEIIAIVDDIDKNKLSDVELSAFMTAVFINGYDLEEIVSMTTALTENGIKLKCAKDFVVDKHSIGGINGRATMIIVPIIAAGGMYMPKTSSRSITSAAGTADSMEVLANVSLPSNKLCKIVEDVGGIVVWGGSLDLAPVDDKIIKVEYPLSMDPEGQVIASVMAKKSSAGAKYVVIDIPVGVGMKIESREKGVLLAQKFIEVGKQLGMKVEAVLTDGSQPSGKAFGPALEAKYVLEILEGKFYDNLAQKSCELAGILFELTGKSKEGEGYDLAKSLLESGEALIKFKEMIKAQGEIVSSSEEVELASNPRLIKAKSNGVISSFDVKKLITIARATGAPADKKAGILMRVEEGDKVKKGDVLMEIYGTNPRKLDIAEKAANENKIIKMERVILQKVV